MGGGSVRGISADPKSSGQPLTWGGFTSNSLKAGIFARTTRIYRETRFDSTQGM